MRDNSEMTDLTKVNAETQLQPENTFKKKSKCARMFGRVGNIFMTLIASNLYSSHIQSQLHDLVGDSLSSISKFVISYEESKTWDEWATYFEHKDISTLNLREAGIFLVLCTRMQQSLLDKVSDSSFSWDSISLEEEVFHLECAAQLQEYLYENSKVSIRKKIGYYFSVLRLCNEFWINFFDIVNEYDELCHEYVQAIFKASREYIEKNILDDEEGIIHTFDSKGEPFAYNIKDLYPSEDSYEYMKKQSKIFEESLPELVSKHAGEYVLFEDGNVIDHDKNENKLLDRIWETDFVNERMGANGSGIYCHLVPNQIPVNV
jgi:Family of unknown function (DUF5678)